MYLVLHESVFWLLPVNISCSTAECGGGRGASTQPGRRGTSHDLGRPHPLSRTSSVPI